MTPIQHLQLVANATESAPLTGPDRDRVRSSLQELAKLLQPNPAPVAETKKK